MVDWDELNDYGPFVLRLFFGVAFLVAGLDKVLSFDMAKGMFEGLFAPWLGGGLGASMLVLAIVIELLGGLALLLGVYTRAASGFLALFILIAFVLTAKLGASMHFIGTLRELMVMNTGGGNTAVNFAYFGALLALVFSGSKKLALKPE